MCSVRPLALVTAAPTPAVAARVLVALALAGCVPPIAAARDCVDYRSYVQYLDVTPLPEMPRDIAVAGDVAYVAAGSQVYVVDLAVPGGPAIVATLQERASRLEVEPPYLYVAGNDFTIIDVGDPLSPKVVGRLTPPEPPGEVAVQGNHAFLFQGANPQRLMVVDVSDPTAPKIVSSEAVSYLSDRFVISGHHLYALSSITFLIFDISNPAQPVMVGTFGGLGFPWDIGVSGNYVFASGTTDWANGFQVYDATDVTNPVFVTDVPLPNAFGMDVKGNLAVVTTFTGDLQVVDIADPIHPVLRASPAAHFAWDVTLEEGVAYLPVDTALERVQVGNGRWVEPLGSAPSPTAIDLDAVGKCVYLLDRTAGLRVVDVRDERNPQVIGALPIGLPSGISVRLPYAYVANGNQGLLTVDVSDPAHPHLAGLLQESVLATDVALLGKYALLASPNGLVVVDVRKPSEPRRVADLSTPALESIAVRGHYAFAAASTAGLLAFDLADPESPRLADQIDTPGTAHEVAIDGALAYVADQTGVAIIDIGNPADLDLVAVYPTSGETYGVTGGNGLFYAAESDLGFVCVDASLPEQPVLIGRAEIGGRLQRGLVIGDRVFAAALAGGLEILPAHCAQFPTGIGLSPSPPWISMRVGLAAPNPFWPTMSVASIPFELAKRMAVRFEVFDVQGRLVRAAPWRTLEAGGQVATWDGRLEFGAPAPAGVYFARLRTGDQTVTRRMVVAP